MPTKKELHFIRESDLEFFGTQPVQFGTEPHPRYSPRKLGFFDSKRQNLKRNTVKKP